MCIITYYQDQLIPNQYGLHIFQNVLVFSVYASKTNTTYHHTTTLLCYHQSYFTCIFKLDPYCSLPPTIHPFIAHHILNASIAPLPHPSPTHKTKVSSCNICVVVVSGASLNTDIGPDSEAQIAPQHDDYDGKDYDHEGHQESDHHTDITEKSEKLATSNGHKNGVEKTNTPV